MSKHEIQSHALYPRDGIAWAHRRQTSWQQPVGEPWPQLLAGDEVIVHDTQGWTWTAVVEEADTASEADAKAKLRIISDKRAQPFPVIVDGRLVLPNVSGHAHARRWARGDIVQVDGFATDFAKVVKVRELQNGSRIEYTLVPATAAQFETRPGRIAMHSSDQATAAVGSAIATKSGEWLHVKSVKVTSFHGAAGRGTTYWAVGRHVAAPKAAKINDTHAPLLSRALVSHHGTRVQSQMPEDAVVLVPADSRSLAATGERLAVVGGEVWHERCGDPDRLDSWYRYVVRIDDADLADRARRFVKAERKKSR